MTIRKKILGRAAGLAAVVVVASLVAAPAAATPPSTPAAVLNSVQASGTSVSLQWTDRSQDEDEFWVFRRDAAGGKLLQIGAVTSTSSTGVGQTYSFTDTIAAGTRQCYEVSTFVMFGRAGEEFSNELCTSPLPPVPVPAPGVGSTTTMADPNPKLGNRMSSMAIGSDGLAIMSYLNYDPHDSNPVKQLRFARCQNPGCTAITSIGIDSMYDAIDPASIKVGSDGLPIMSYVVPRNAAGQTVDDLRVAYCRNIACTSVTINTIDPAATAFRQTSLTIGGDGLPLIAYRDYSQANGWYVKVAKCLNRSCSETKVSIIDTASPVSDDVSIATAANGFAILAYESEVGNHDSHLKVARCFNADCSSVTTTSVDQFVGYRHEIRDPSLTIGRDGLGLITYVHKDHHGYEEVLVAHCVNFTCTAVTTTTVSTNAVVANENPQITIGGDGLGVIVYSDEDNDDAKVAHCNDIACTSTTTVTLDSAGDTGNYPSITTGVDGLPLISYSAWPALKVVHCPNVTCSGGIGAAS
ncbi:hypothetical protein ACFFX1_49370 [Dactylosporangium sucinum]|uniref:Fibronectin type-III domain-containing protein n=1 Tax=Dactylosporangium sucinum TaxID=1424081 RepID=A0A917UHB2_9ACTN|nr:hypothetical protein [Dactylosporangium sucinum]GGM90524.1 hypothetical protein GCM10007977_110670 [Dactylosporangium sucinum]